MQTQCSSTQLRFQELGPREVIADFQGGTLTSDAGALLLRQVDLAKRYSEDFAACFRDERDTRYTEHSVTQLVRQRVLGLCLGYEDLNDHDRLRHDPLFATACGAVDPTGSGRKYARDQGKPLAGKSTLNRLETTPPGRIRPRAKKIIYDPQAIESYFVQKFLQSRRSVPRRLILDLDCTDTILHGHQQGRFFHGYYDCYCYLPLYVFCGNDLLAACLRPSNIDPSEGALEEIQRLVQQIRKKWPRVRILIRGDSGFCREAIMSWCEAQGVDYLFGLARNSRLHRRISNELAQAREAFQQTRQPQRVYKDFRYRTRSQLVVLPAGDRQGGVPGQRRKPALRGELPACRVHRRPGSCTRKCTARGARWKTASRSSSCTCSPPAPPRPRCGPISCGCGSRPWPT